MVLNSSTKHRVERLQSVSILQIRRIPRRELTSAMTDVMGPNL